MLAIHCSIQETVSTYSNWFQVCKLFLAQDNTSFLHLLLAKSTSGIDDISIQDYNINSCIKNSNVT